MNLWTIMLLGVSVAGCAAQAGDDSTDDSANTGEETADIASAGAYYHLDATTNHTGPATLSVVNGYKVRCPDGSFATTCKVAALDLPADCGFECQDGLLSLQGESVVRGSFSGTHFRITDGFDTYARGLGTYSIYRITGAAKCAADPCPTKLVAQKLDTTAAATAITAVDFSHASDPNYVLDPTRGDAQIATPAGLLVSGHIVSHQFRADRVWREETVAPGACNPQETARASIDPQDARGVIQVRTVAEAERLAPVDPDLGGNVWLVRTGESATASTFTSGLADLWAQVFTVSKATCAITVIAEH